MSLVERCDGGWTPTKDQKSFSLYCSGIRSVFPLIFQVLITLGRNTSWDCFEGSSDFHYEITLSFFIYLRREWHWRYRFMVMLQANLWFFGSWLRRRCCFRRLLFGSWWNSATYRGRWGFLASKNELLCWWFWNFAHLLCFWRWLQLIWTNYLVFHYWEQMLRRLKKHW